MEELARDQWFVDRKARSTFRTVWLLTSTAWHAILLV